MIQLSDVQSAPGMRTIQVVIGSLIETSSNESVKMGVVPVCCGSEANRDVFIELLIAGVDARALTGGAKFTYGNVEQKTAPFPLLQDKERSNKTDGVFFLQANFLPQSNFGVVLIFPDAGVTQNFIRLLDLTKMKFGSLNLFLFLGESYCLTPVSVGLLCEVPIRSQNVALQALPTVHGPEVMEDILITIFPMIEVFSDESVKAGLIPFRCGSKANRDAFIKMLITGVDARALTGGSRFTCGNLAQVTAPFPILRDDEKWNKLNGQFFLQANISRRYGGRPVLIFPDAGITDNFVRLLSLEFSIVGSHFCLLPGGRFVLSCNVLIDQSCDALSQEELTDYAPSVEALDPPDLAPSVEALDPEPEVEMRTMQIVIESMIEMFSEGMGLVPVRCGSEAHRDRFLEMLITGVDACALVGGTKLMSDDLEQIMEPFPLLKDDERSNKAGGVFFLYAFIAGPQIILRFPDDGVKRNFIQLLGLEDVWQLSHDSILMLKRGFCIAPSCLYAVCDVQTGRRQHVALQIGPTTDPQEERCVRQLPPVLMGLFTLWIDRPLPNHHTLQFDSSLVLADLMMDATVLIIRDSLYPDASLFSLLSFISVGNGGLVFPGETVGETVHLQPFHCLVDAKIVRAFLQHFGLNGEMVDETKAKTTIRLSIQGYDNF